MVVDTSEIEEGEAVDNTMIYVAVGAIVVVAVIVGAYGFMRKKK